jgi:hypothetical protein
MVTPTFAAGLGIVVAAVLVYPMTRTVFKYSGPGWGGVNCQTAGCKASGQGGGPASARPGHKIVPPPSAPPSPTAPAQPPASSPRKASPPASGTPTVSYQTAHQWEGGFQELITITFGSGSVPAHWGLWFSYRTANHIFGVWGGRWAPHGSQTAVVTDPGKQAPPVEGNSIKIYVAVTGSPGAPSGCSFDHQPCHTN